MNDSAPPTQNTVRVLPEGVVEYIQVGYQTVQNAFAHQVELDNLTKQLRSQGKKALVLVDLSGVTGHDPEVRDMAKERLKGGFDALALFGTSPPIRMITNWLIHAVGENKRIRFFDDRQKALVWLLSH